MAGIVFGAHPHQPDHLIKIMGMRFRGDRYIAVPHPDKIGIKCPGRGIVIQGNNAGNIGGWFLRMVSRPMRFRFSDDIPGIP